MTEKIRSPKEVICLLVWNQPRNVTEIQKKMYGKRNSRVPGWITELRKDGWIKKVEDFNKDQREDYYIANPFAFRYYLLNWFDIAGIKLLKKEKQIIRDISKSPGLKKYIGYIIEKCLEKNRLPDLFYVLETFCYDCTFYGFLIRHDNINTKILTSKTKINDDEKIYLVDIEDMTDIFYMLGQSLLDKIANLNPEKFVLLNSYFEVLSDYFKTQN